MDIQAHKRSFSDREESDPSSSLNVLQKAVRTSLQSDGAIMRSAEEIVKDTLAIELTAETAPEIKKAVIAHPLPVELKLDKAWASLDHIIRGTHWPITHARDHQEVRRRHADLAGWVRMAACRVKIMSSHIE